MALEWFNREDGHAASWLYIEEQEQQQGDGESLVLEQDTDNHQRFPCNDETSADDSRVQNTRTTDPLDCGPNGKPQRGNKQTKKKKAF